MNKISRYDSKRAFTVFQTMVEVDIVAPSQTTESEKDNSFLGFHNCIKSCPQLARYSFNLSNVAIPKNMGAFRQSV